MFLNINMKVVGVDLAGKSENPTGFCLLTEQGSETKILYSDLDILNEIELTKPECIAIDAPFWLPKFGAWRPAEEKLLKRGFQPVSPLFPTMRILVIRASKLVKELVQRKYRVIEVFSGASEKILGLSKEPRKNKDEYDALLCALTAKAYLKGNYEDLGGIIIPK
jgi:predicted nuclease with RNAse H fold